MSQEQYRVILTGYATSKGEYYVEIDFAKLFKITREKAKELFKTSPTTIKEGLSLEEANQYKSAIEKTGATCDVENMKYDLGGLSLE